MRRPVSYEQPLFAVYQVRQRSDGYVDVTSVADPEGGLCGGRGLCGVLYTFALQKLFTLFEANTNKERSTNAMM